MQKTARRKQSDVLPKNEIKLSKSHFDLLTVSRNGKKTYYVIIA